MFRPPVTPSASITISTEEEFTWSSICMCMLLNPGTTNLPVALIDGRDGSFGTSALGVILTIRPWSIRMLIPGVSLPSSVSTRVTPSSRSLPDRGSSTFAGGCLRHPESSAAKTLATSLPSKRIVTWIFAFRFMRWARPPTWRRITDALFRDGVPPLGILALQASQHSQRACRHHRLTKI